jgi:hypothetical protein
MEQQEGLPTPQTLNPKPQRNYQTPDPKPRAIVKLTPPCLTPHKATVLDIKPSWHNHNLNLKTLNLNPEP